MSALEISFWACVALLAHTHLGYPLALAALEWLSFGPGPPRDDPPDPLPSVALIIAAHNEEDVIAQKVANALALSYPRELLRVVVASDGSTDATVQRARDAGADLVLDLERAGKIAAQNAAVVASESQVLAFSDANSVWEPEALTELIAAFGDPEVGYVSGQASFSDPAGDNVEGAYWRYELAVRRRESALGGITAGNGAIYATRREAYLALPPSRSHDLSFPFMLKKRGWRSVYAPAARSSEPMVPTLEGELTRKRRMMVGVWDIVVADGMARPRGYGFLFGFQILSHRLLRYASPFLHLVIFGLNLTLLGEGPIYLITLAAQLALLAGALLAPRIGDPLTRLCRYYVMVTASIALGLADRLRGGPPGTWERAEGTR